MEYLLRLPWEILRHASDDETDLTVRTDERERQRDDETKKEEKMTTLEVRIKLGSPKTEDDGGECNGVPQLPCKR
jgi:hypothetical protein